MRGGWQRDEQFDHDCLLPEREEIEEAIMQRGYTLYPRGNPITNTYAWLRTKGHFHVYDTAKAYIYKCPIEGLELGTPELKILFSSGPKVLNEFLLNPSKSRKKPKRFKQRYIF